VDLQRIAREKRRAAEGKVPAFLFWEGNGKVTSTIRGPGIRTRGGGGEKGKEERPFFNTARKSLPFLGTSEGKKRVIEREEVNHSRPERRGELD